MVFSVVGGGISMPTAMLLPGLGQEEAAQEAAPPDDVGGEPGDIDASGSYEDAVLLNQQLKAMLAAAQAAGPPSSAGSPGGGRRQQRRPPRAPTGRCQAPARESSQGPGRRKADQRATVADAGLSAAYSSAVPRQAPRSRSCLLPPLAGADERRGSREEPLDPVRRKLDPALAREDPSFEEGVCLGSKQIKRSKSCGPPGRLGGGPGLPPGWTRGLGGRMLPPPELRWGSSKYDAGEWNS